MSVGPGFTQLTVMPRPRQVGGEARGELVQRSLGSHVGQLARHRTEVLSGGEEHDVPAFAPVVLGGKGPHEQQRRTRVDREGEVELGRGQILERNLRGAGVVGHERVDVPVGVHRGFQDPVRRGRVGEVGGQVRDASTSCPKLPAERLDTTRIAAPGLLVVVRRPRAKEEIGAARREQPCDAGADRGATTDPGHEHHPAGQRFLGHARRKSKIQA